MSDDVEVAAPRRAASTAAGEVGGLDLEALRLEQQPQRLQDVRLVVGDEDARHQPAHGNSRFYSAVEESRGHAHGLRYSLRSAITGSTRVARRAGT